MIEFKNIDKENYIECISLKLKEHQKDFVAENAQSLLDAYYLDGLETLGIYHNNKMVGFILYDYDSELQGWSISRFMIGDEYQGKGFGKTALKLFLDEFSSKFENKPLYACISIHNKNTISLFEKFDFKFVGEIEYTFLNKVYKEFKYIKL